MRLVGSMLALGMGLGLATAAFAEAMPAPTATHIDQLIARLGSGQFSEREEAAATLERLGAEALESLRRAADSPDLEVRRRAEELTSRIELRVDSRRLLAGKKVSLAYQDVVVSEAMTDFSRRTGLTLKVHSDDEVLADLNNRKLTLDTGEVSVWEGLERFCAATGLQESAIFTDSLEAMTCRLRLGKTAALPTCRTGALRIRAVNQNAPGWGQTPGVVDAPCVLEVVAEPGMIWHGVADIRIHKAIDERGQELAQQTGGLELQGGDGFAEARWEMKRFLQNEVGVSSQMGGKHHVSFKLKLGKEQSQVVKELHGTLVGQMQTPLEPLLIVDNILQMAGQTYKGSDGSIVKVGPVNRDKDGRTQLDVEFQTAPAEDLLQMAFGMNNRRAMNQALIFQLRSRDRLGAIPNLELRDAAGKLVEVARYNEVNQVAGTKGTYTATLHILPKSGVGDPVRLQLLGRRTAIVEVPFILKDVPLP